MKKGQKKSLIYYCKQTGGAKCRKHKTLCSDFGYCEKCNEELNKSIELKNKTK